MSLSKIFVNNTQVTSVDSAPTPESANLINSGGIAETLGFFIEDSIAGNGSNWRTKKYSSYTIKANEPIKLKVTGPITFAGISETNTFLLIVLIKNGMSESSGNYIKWFYQLIGSDEFEDREILYTPNQDCYLYVEGRWHTDETLNINLCKNLIPQVEINAKDLSIVNPLVTQHNKLLRGSAKVVHCSKLNFDNTNKKVVFSTILLANPNGSGRLNISSGELEYTFSAQTTTAYQLIYNSQSGQLDWLFSGNASLDDIIICCVTIWGSGQNGKVTEVCWSAVENVTIDGISVKNTLITSALDLYKKNIPLLSIIRGTIWKGISSYDDKVCLLCDDYISVYGGSEIDCIHANDISIRINQYDENKTYIKQNETYSKFEKLILEYNTRFIRISASYSERGFNANNPVSYSNYTEGDFGVKVYRSKEFEKTEFVYKRLIDNYGDKPYFIDGNKWMNCDATTGTGSGYASYVSRIIPVKGGGKIVCKANQTIPTRISFLNSFDEDYVLSHFGSTVDGTGNQNTAAGQTRTYDIPITCTHICLNTKYVKDSMPASLIIDGIEYIGNIQDSVQYIGNTLIDSTKPITNIETVLGYNYEYAQFTIKAGTIWNGTAISSGDCLYGEEYIDVSGGDTLNTIYAQYVYIRITEYDINKKYLRGSSTYAQFSTRTLGNDTRYVRISASYRDDTYTTENPITPEHFKDGDFGFYYNKSEVIKRLNSVESEVNDIGDVSSKNIFGRNREHDAAVRATGQKAVTADILPLSFIHISDIHTKGDNYKCFKNACQFYQHYNNIKAMIVTGDIVWDTYADQTTWYDEALAETTKPVLNVIGNHDAGQYNSSIGLGSQSSDLECYNKFIAPYVNAGTLANGVSVPGWGVVQPSNAATEGKSYYYKDFADEKIRLIVLCEFETDYEIKQDQTGLVYSREFRAMRQTQVTWLIDTLTNTPSDYGVIVSYHQPDDLKNEDNDFVSFDLTGDYRQSVDSEHRESARSIANVYCTDKEWLPKILNAFATKTSLTLTVTQTGAVVTSSPTLVCDCDFTNVQSEFICILNGHTHRDYIGHLTHFPNLTILCIGADNMQYTSKFCPRAADTKSEDLFNVVNIDRNRKTIKIIRIGSNASVTGQVRDQMIMNYATT